MEYSDDIVQIIIFSILFIAAVWKFRNVEMYLLQLFTYFPLVNWRHCARAVVATPLMFLFFGVTTWMWVFTQYMQSSWFVSFYFSNSLYFVDDDEKSNSCCWFEDSYDSRRVGERSGSKSTKTRWRERETYERTEEPAVGDVIRVHLLFWYQAREILRNFINFLNESKSDSLNRSIKSTHIILISLLRIICVVHASINIFDGVKVRAWTVFIFVKESERLDSLRTVGYYALE